MKIIFIAVTAVVFLYSITHDYLFLQADATSNNTAQIILAIGSVMGIIFGFLSPFALIWFNKKMNGVAATTQDTNNKMHEVAGKVDGLLEKKAIADEAIGKLKGIEQAAKEKAIADDRELQVRKEQDLLNQTPPNRDTKRDVSDVKESIETEIRKQGEKIQDAVKEKGDEIKTEVPDKTAEKVVEKLDPDKK